MKKVCTYLCAATALWLLFAGSMLRQQKLAGRLIRLHVLANSDESEDQAEKLAVRDALLPHIAAMTESCRSQASALQVLDGQAETLGQLAAAVCGKAVTVDVSAEWYPTLSYSTISLPAGRYVSLQVKIGAAKGHNWWCVAFPSVCTAASSTQLQHAAAVAGLDGQDLRMMTEQEPDIQIRYAILELFEKIRALFSD